MTDEEFDFVNELNNEIDRLTLKASNLEEQLNEAKDYADSFYTELKLYKKAFELAYYRGDEFICEEDVLKKAKEEIGEQKTGEEEKKKDNN